MYPRTDASCGRETTGPICVSSFVPGPSFIFCTFSASFRRKSSRTESWTNTRLPAQHIWPEFWKAPNSTPFRALSSFASGNTICGFFPPSSSVTGVTWRAASCIICFPVSVEPVNVIESTSGCPARAEPAEEPPERRMADRGRDQQDEQDAGHAEQQSTDDHPRDVYLHGSPYRTPCPGT